jgi:hypothetical protein
MNCTECFRCDARSANKNFWSIIGKEVGSKLQAAPTIGDGGDREDYLAGTAL